MDLDKRIEELKKMKEKYELMIEERDFDIRFDQKIKSWLDDVREDFNETCLSIKKEMSKQIIMEVINKNITNEFKNIIDGCNALVFRNNHVSNHIYFMTDFTIEFIVKDEFKQYFTHNIVWNHDVHFQWSSEIASSIFKTKFQDNVKKAFQLFQTKKLATLRKVKEREEKRTDKYNVYLKLKEEFESKSE
jgi:hypothetical protein